VFIQTCENQQFESINKRQGSNYALIIEEINNILFWIKTAPIPGISLSDDSEGYYEGVPHAIQGNTFSYDSPIPLTFFLDEKLYVLQYLYRWIRGFQMDKDYEGVKQKQASIILFDNDSNKVNGIFNFQNMYCKEITQIDLNNNGSENMEISASFSFDIWTPEFKYKI